jgi:hypothetical protein
VSWFLLFQQGGARAGGRAGAAAHANACSLSHTYKKHTKTKKKQNKTGFGVGGAGIVLAKADVNGADASPLFQYLRSEASGLIGDSIKWNFTKFLVDKNGKVKRFAPTTTPEAIEADIIKAIA